MDTTLYSQADGHNKVYKVVLEQCENTLWYVHAVSGPIGSAGVVRPRAEAQGVEYSVALRVYHELIRSKMIGKAGYVLRLKPAPLNED
jgi:hypothetical protein